jgi:Na+-transporting methylmalonyl-CoA/oxaloacetate decarboxylase gamma subunit
MNVLAVWPSNEPVNVGNALLIAVIAIFIVFLVLSIIIFVTWLLQKSMEKINAKTNILPKEENKILSEDENAVVAALVASMEFYRETGKEVRIVSIKRIED